MSEQTIEQRLSTLEAEVARLKAELQNNINAKPLVELPWWEKSFGIFENDPDYIEAIRLGREYRQAQQPNAENLAT